MLRKDDNLLTTDRGHCHKMLVAQKLPELVDTFLHLLLPREKHQDIPRLLPSM